MTSSIYFTQLSNGCGSSTCSNPFCASSSRPRIPEVAWRAASMFLARSGDKYFCSKFKHIKQLGGLRTMGLIPSSGLRYMNTILSRNTDSTRATDSKNALENLQRLKGSGSEADVVALIPAAFSSAATLVAAFATNGVAFTSLVHSVLVCGRRCRVVLGYSITKLLENVSEDDWMVYILLSDCPIIAERPIFRLFCLSVMSHSHLTDVKRQCHGIDRLIDIGHSYLASARGDSASWVVDYRAHVAVAQFLQLLSPLTSKSIVSAAVCTHMNPKGDYNRWKNDDAGFSYCYYPSLLSTAMKSALLRVHAANSMSSEVESAVVNASWYQRSIEHINHRGGNASNEPISIHLVLNVRRDAIVRDACECLTKSHNSLKKPLKIVFAGEEGMDVGGVQKEFFQIIFRILFSPDIGLFVVCDDDRLWFNPSSLISSSLYTYVGMLVGLAFYNGVTIAARFPRILFHLLLFGYRDWSTTELLTFLGDVDSDLANGLSSLIASPTDGYTFSVTSMDMGVITTHCLVENGDEVEVSADQCDHYVSLYAYWITIGRVKRQLDAFICGFNRVNDGNKMMHLLTPADIELIICGSPALNIASLQKSALYDDGYHSKHRVVKWLWKSVHKMDEQTKRKFLAFVTGSDRVPIGGLSPPFTIARHGPSSDLLPSAMTCANRLFVPDYSSGRMLASKLMTSLQHTEGFGLV